MKLTVRFLGCFLLLWFGFLGSRKEAQLLANFSLIYQTNALLFVDCGLLLFIH